VEQLRKATERIDGTIRDLLNFSRPAEDEQSQCEVRRDVAEVVALVRPQKRFRDVAVRFEDRVAGPARCRIPPSRLKQVLLNLLLNAADAMEGKGDLTVTLEREEGRVRLSVQDSGPGIDEKVLLKIFDPFFTTKGVGKGTGLGLYVCHTIVGRYGGEMEVDAGMGRGARFTVKLPEA
jgi:signal transduction histidine kinase